MSPKPHAKRARQLVLIHELVGDLPDAIAEQDDGIYLFRRRPPIVEIERLRDGEGAGKPGPVASLTLTHSKVDPQWLTATELVYLGERIGPDGKPVAGQTLYRAPTEEPGRYTVVADYALGCFHFVARQGAVRFFERIGTGHDAYYEDGFIAWDTAKGGVVAHVAELPEGTSPAFPPYLHSFSHRQGDPTLELGAYRFSLKRLRAGNDATWAIERAKDGAAAKPITGEHETVSCARLARDRLLYLRGPAPVGGVPGATAASVSGDNTLVCHLASDPERSIEAPCGPASAWRVSAGRASLFHVHGELIAVLTDRLRIFRLE